MNTRKKLTAEQVTEIKQKFESGKCTIMGLSKEYGVSRNLIYRTLNPEYSARINARNRRRYHEAMKGVCKEDKVRVFDKDELMELKAAHEAGTYTVKELCQKFRINQSRLYYLLTNYDKYMEQFEEGNE